MKVTYDNDVNNKQHKMQCFFNFTDKFPSLNQHFMENSSEIIRKFSIIGKTFIICFMYFYVIFYV